VTREYHPALDVTAGELRALGMKVEAEVPDCAWVPRSAFRVLSSRLTSLEGETGTISVSMTIGAPWRWVECDLVFESPTG